MYGNQKVLTHFKDDPQHIRRILSLISSAEDLRGLADSGMLQLISHHYGELTKYAREVKSGRALFILTGVEAKVAELRGDHKTAENIFKEQLKLATEHPAVKSEENRAQVYADLSQNAIHSKQIEKAKTYFGRAMECKQKFLNTVRQLKELKERISN